MGSSAGWVLNLAPAPLCPRSFEQNASKVTKQLTESRKKARDKVNDQRMDNSHPEKHNESES